MDQDPTARLSQLLDEVRLKLHLLGMDARDTFERINDEATQLGRAGGRRAQQQAHKLIERLNALANRFEGP